MDNERALVTHSTLADLVWKIDCAKANTNCGTMGSTLLSLQGDPVTAARHESLRAIVEGAGTVGGVGGRAVDTVVGLVGLLKESMPISQMGKSWGAFEYVNEFGLDAYLDAERKKSSAVWTGLASGLEGYIKDAGSALGGKLTGDDYSDLYDVYRQGNIGGKIGFDIASSFVGGAEVGVLAKSLLVDRKVAIAFSSARAEALDSARIANNFYRDGSSLAFPRELKTSSGIIIHANPDKTTTVLGSYLSDMDSVMNAQLGASKNMLYDGLPQPGSFNVLNAPDALYGGLNSALGPNGFWDRVNRPFLDAAIARGDDIVLATRPAHDVLYRYDRKLGREVKTGFGQEYDYLLSKGYRYDDVTGRMVR